MSAIQLGSLSATDQQAICRALKLPLPTPDISLDMIITQEKIHPADVLVRLERSRDLRAMVAAATLRGRLQRCPPDARLSPKPYPYAPVRSPKTAAERERQPAPAPVKTPVRMNNTRTLVSFVSNPKQLGSAARDRYDLYKVGLTEPELLARGITRSDLRHDTGRGFIKWAE